MNDNLPEKTVSNDRRDAGYLLAVGGLMMVIIVSLAILWLTERNKRLEAERLAAEAKSLRVQYERLSAMMGPLLNQGMVSPMEATNNEQKAEKEEAIDSKWGIPVSPAADAITTSPVTSRPATTQSSE